MKCSKAICLTMCALVFSTIVCSADNNLPEGFTVVGTSDSYKLVLTPYTTYPLQYEEVMPIVSSEPIKYISKLVHEGQWGDEPGNFGIIRLAKYDMPVDLGPDSSILPETCVVDSKGNIYTLDTVNNRIQKFDRYGNFLCVIPVFSLADRMGVSVAQKIVYPKGDELYPEGRIDFEEKSPPYFTGVDIAVGVNDQLYYLVGKKDLTAELWEFRNDKVKRKIGGIPNSRKMKASKIRIIKNEPFIEILDFQKHNDKICDPSNGKLWSKESLLKKRDFGTFTVILLNNKPKELLIMTSGQLRRVMLPFKEPFLMHYDYENLGVLDDGRMYFQISHGAGAAFSINTYVLNHDATSIMRLVGAPIPSRPVYFEYSSPNILRYEKE